MKLDKPKYLTKCGHIAIATLYDKPCCIFCTGPTSRLIDREILEDTDGLEGRKAKCYWCNKVTESKWTLPFFEYKPKHFFDSYYCGCGGWD